jgi:hypothetical protein
VKFQQGLSITERQEIRKQKLQELIDYAHYQASIVNATDKCRRAILLVRASIEDGNEDPVRARQIARELHESCKGEWPRSTGCLCTCHDIIQGVVIQ